LFRGWGKAPERITLIFGDIRILQLFDKYSPASESFVPRPEALDPGPYMHWLEVPHNAMTVQTYHPEVSK